MAEAPRDQNHVPTALFESSSTPGLTLPGRIDEITGRVLVDNSGGGSGTVTSVSVVTANGFAGTVATATTTPAITLTTTITGILKGNGTAISAATAGTDYTALAFKTFAVSGQSDVVADSAADTLTLAAGTGMVITTNAATDTITFTVSGGSATDITVGSTTVSSGTTTRILYDNAGVLGEYTITGSGTVVVMQTSPTLVTPILGVAAATSINKVAITAPATSATLTIADGKTVTHNASTTFAGTDSKTLTISNSGTLGGGDAFVLAIAAGKTLTVSNTLTFTGTDSSSVAFGTGGTVLYTASTIPLTVGSTTIASGTSTRILYDNAGVLGEYTLTGTGTVVVMQASPTLTTPVLGVATATSINKVAITAPATSSTLTIADGKTLTASDTTILATNAITLGGGEVITFSASNALSLLTTGTSVMTFPTATDTVVTLAATQTLTNKRKQPRTVAATSYTTDTGTSLTVATADDFVITAQAGALKFNNPGGTPVNGETLVIRIKDDGTARALTYDTQFRASSDLALPTTTVLSKTLYMGFKFNSTDTKWDLLAVLNNF